MHALSLLALLVACGSPAPEAAPAVDAPADAAKAADAKDADATAQGHEAQHPDMKVEAVLADGWAIYGDGFTLDTSEDCAGLIADPAAHENKTVRVTGRIDNVCQKAGCWMILANADGEYLRVAMKGHAFGVPTDTRTGEGTQADIEGVLVKKELTQKALDHYKGEASGTPEEIEKQFAPKYELVASTVAVKQG